MRTHDGFYLRTGLGFGYGRVESEFDNFDATYTGGNVLFDILLGGTIANMVVIGGGIQVSSLSDPSVELSNEDDMETASTETDGSVGVATIGPLIDIFFGPHSGGHVGTSIGVANITFEGDESDETSDGWGFSFFGGYDFWVSDQWAIGVNARYLWAKSERRYDAFADDTGFADEVVIQDSAHTFGVMFSALYH